MSVSHDGNTVVSPTFPSSLSLSLSLLQATSMQRGCLPLCHLEACYINHTMSVCLSLNTIYTVWYYDWLLTYIVAI